MTFAIRFELYLVRTG